MNFTNTELAALELMTQYEIGLYLNWKLFNKTLKEQISNQGVQYKYRNKFKDLLNVDLFKPLVSRQEVPL